jgi:hypothetical protein
MATHTRELSYQQNRGYFRFVGKDANGTKRRFWLGNDQKLATIAVMKLQQLWDGHVNEIGHWTDLFLPVAQAISHHRQEVKIEGPALRVNALAQLVSNIIRVIPVNVDTYTAEITRHSQADSLYKPVDGIQASTGTLHEAFDDWKTYLASQPDPSGHCHKCQEGVDRFKDHHDDCPLSTLGEQRTHDLLTYWGNRPKGKRGVISVDTAKWHIKRMREFLRWLHRSEKYGWRKPADFAEWRITIKDSADDYALNHPTFTIEELKTLYQSAVPLVRAFMLLALNCAFKHAEISTLKRTEIKDGLIKRIRGKSKVVAEWKLWPETEAALRWATERAEKIGEKTLVFVTAEGKAYNAKTAGGNKPSRIANLWNDTLAKSGLPEDRRLSFKHLEKTASTWIRDHVGGELASMFISHGTPVKHDRLLEKYANKPWAKLHAALDQYRVALQPMFE